jgi:hypothetical protein
MQVAGCRLHVAGCRQRAVVGIKRYYNLKEPEPINVIRQ